MSNLKKLLFGGMADHSLGITFIVCIGFILAIAFSIIPIRHWWHSVKEYETCIKNYPAQLPEATAAQTRIYRAGRDKDCTCVVEAPKLPPNATIEQIRKRALSLRQCEDE